MKRVAGLVPNAPVVISKLKCNFFSLFFFFFFKKKKKKQRKKDGDKNAVAVVEKRSGISRQLSCVSQDIEPPSSVKNLREGQKVLGAIRRARFTDNAPKETRVVSVMTH